MVCLSILVAHGIVATLPAHNTIFKIILLRKLETDKGKGKQKLEQISIQCSLKTAFTDHVFEPFE